MTTTAEAIAVLRQYVDERPFTSPRILAAIKQVLEAVAKLERERDAAEIAEGEAKDCFWAVYPTYVKAVGHGIGTEAARTELAQRALDSEEAVEEAERVIGPLAAVFSTRVDNPKMLPWRRDWNAKMPGEWPIKLTLTMDTGRAAVEWKRKYGSGR